MKVQILMAIMALGLLGGCAPVMIGLTAGQIASNVIKTAVKVREIRQARAEQERLNRAMCPDDFLDVGDPLSKALARLGTPASKEARDDRTYYFFPGQRLMGDAGEVFSRDLRVVVDKQEKIAEIIILDGNNAEGNRT